MMVGCQVVEVQIGLGFVTFDEHKAPTRGMSAPAASLADPFDQVVIGVGTEVFVAHFNFISVERATVAIVP